MNKQNFSLKFCLKLGKTPKETFAMLVGVYEDQVLVFTIGSLARFREGRESVFDNLRSGKPVTSVSDENIEKLFKKDRQLTLCMTADELHINHESTRQIVTQNLGIRKTCCRFVPHHLTDDHKQERLEASQDFVKRANVTPNFFNCISQNEFLPEGAAKNAGNVN
ncbi:UNVERIFIED_CONTAM: hypothetical protein NCL1_33817 [Trichonephila clavipes]